jgi:CheY-like chemotaxis protein
MRRLKADPKTRGIPIIAISGRAVPGTGPGETAAGFSAVVTKPFTLEAVLSAIHLVLLRP